MLSFETQIHFAFLRILQVGTPKPKQRGKKPQSQNRKTHLKPRNTFGRGSTMQDLDPLFLTPVKSSHKQEVTEEIKKHIS